MEETLTLDRIAYRSIYDYAAHYMGHLKDKAQSRLTFWSDASNKRCRGSTR